jgi:HK97 family phage major capsid protein
MSDQFDAKELAKAVEGVKTGFEAFKEANDQRIKEIEVKGSADPLLEEKLAKIEKDMDAKQARLDQFELAMKRQSRTVTDKNGNEIDLDAKAAKWANMVARSRGTRVEDFGAKELDGYKQAFDTFLRKGDEIIGADEKKALSVGTDSDGGYVVHPDMSGAIVTKVFETSPMRAYASIQVISTDSLEGLFDLEEAVSGWVGETDGRPDTGTPQLGKWRIPVHELYAKPKATQKILDDAEINMEAWLAGKVSEKFARDEAAAFVSGNGVNKPRGFLTYVDGTTLPGTIERINTGANGAFTAAPNGGDALIDALYGLKAQYRANATWFMNRATTKLARKLKDSDGAYLWSPGIAAGQPASLLGYPIAAFEDMPNPATGSLSIAVGDMRAAYQIVDRVGIRTLRDPYSAKPYVEFYTTKRVGGDVINFEAIKLLEFSTS